MAGGGEGGGDRAVGDTPPQELAAAAASTVMPPNPLPQSGGGDLGRGGVEVVGSASLRGRGDGSVGDAEVEEGSGGAGAGGGKEAAAAAGRWKHEPPSRPNKKEETTGQYEWVAVPGGRETPPELDEDGEEAADAAVGLGGTMGMVGASSRYKGAGSPLGGPSGAIGGGGGGGGAAVSVVEAPGKEGAVAALASDARPAASRAGAVSVLPAVAATSTAARKAGSADDERDTPRAASAAAAAFAPSTVAAADEPSAGAGAGAGGSSGILENGIEWQRARAILDDMVAANHLPPPPAAAFQAVLGACDAAGRIGEALEVASTMVEAGHSPSQRLVARLMASHADVLDRERREMEEAAAAPAEDWGG